MAVSGPLSSNTGHTRSPSALSGADCTTAYTLDASGIPPTFGWSFQFAACGTDGAGDSTPSSCPARRPGGGGLALSRSLWRESLRWSRAHHPGPVRRARAPWAPAAVGVATALESAAV